MRAREGSFRMSVSFGERGRSKLRLFAPFVIGYALLDAWSQTVFSTSFFVQTTPSDQILKYFVALLPAFVLMVLSSRIRTLGLRRYREVLYLFGAAASMGTGLFLFIMYGALDGYWTKAVLLVLMVARVCLMVCWWERLTAYSLKDMWLLLGCAIVLSSLFSLIPPLAPEALGDCLVTAAPFVSTVLLPVRGGREGDGAPEPVGEGLSLRVMLRAVPWALVIVLGLVNIPSEALVIFEMMGDVEGSGDANLLVNTATRVFVNLAALLLAYFAVRVDVNLTFGVVVLIVMVASFLLALDVDASFSILHTACRIGSEMMRYVIVYMLFSAVVKQRTPALFCFSFMMFAHSAGSFVGAVVAFGLARDLTVVALLFMSVLLAALLLVIVAMRRSMLMAASRTASAADVGAGSDGAAFAAHVATEAGATPSAEGVLSAEGMPEVSGACSDASAASAASAAAPVDAERAFAEHYGLTQREYEVLCLWLRGRTAAYIEEQLCISKYTVKTHVNHIYEKTGVNSKEGLISLAESFADSL